MLKRLPRRARWLIVAAVVAGAPVAWYLGSPLFINKTVDEPFPTNTGTQNAGADAYPMSKNATVPSDMTQQQVEDKMMEASKTEAQAADAMPDGAAQGAVVARGTFVDADTFHKGEGTATVHKIGQGLVLRFETFKVTNGPDLRVILTKAAAPKTRADVEAGYVEVAKLKGNVGSQNYVLPADLHLDDYKAAIIYCKPFHVVFATASLQGAK
jgi:hypothetical protein